MYRRHFTVLEEALASLKPERDFVEPIPEPPPPGAARHVKTAVPLAQLEALNASLLSRPAGFQQHRKLDRARERRQADAGQPGRADDRLGRRRGAGVRLDPRRRHPDPPHRRGRRARHVQPPPRRLPRRGHRQAPHPAAGARAGQGGLRDPQQPAHRGRHRRLRVRLQRPGAGPAGGVGGAVRRLHQRRPGDHRRVHHLGPRQVGPDAVAGAAAAARLRRPGPRSLARAPRALPRVRRRHQPAPGQLHDRGAVLPPAAPPGAAARRPIRCR